MNYLEMFAAITVGILSVARTARLLTWDDFPPAVWLRLKWDDLTNDGPWSKLMHCQFCITPYLAAGMAGWAWLSDCNTAWWVINGIWGLSYVAAIVVSYDQPED